MLLLAVDERVMTRALPAILVAVVVLALGCGSETGWGGYTYCTCVITCPSGETHDDNYVMEGSPPPLRAQENAFESCEMSKDVYCEEPPTEDCSCSCWQ